MAKAHVNIPFSRIHELTAEDLELVGTAIRSDHSTSYPLKKQINVIVGAMSITEVFRDSRIKADSDRVVNRPWKPSSKTCRSAVQLSFEGMDGQGPARLKAFGETVRAAFENKFSGENESIKKARFDSVFAATNKEGTSKVGYTNPYLPTTMADFSTDTYVINPSGWGIAVPQANGAPLTKTLTKEQWTHNLMGATWQKPIMGSAVLSFDKFYIAKGHVGCRIDIKNFKWTLISGERASQLFPTSSTLAEPEADAIDMLTAEANNLLGDVPAQEAEGSRIESILAGTNLMGDPKDRETSSRKRAKISRSKKPAKKPAPELISSETSEDSGDDDNE